MEDIQDLIYQQRVYEELQAIRLITDPYERIQARKEFMEMLRNGEFY